MSLPISCLSHPPPSLLQSIHPRTQGPQKIILPPVQYGLGILPTFSQTPHNHLPDYPHHTTLHYTSSLPPFRCYSFMFLLSSLPPDSRSTRWIYPIRKRCLHTDVLHTMGNSIGKTCDYHALRGWHTCHLLALFTNCRSYFHFIPSLFCELGFHFGYWCSPF
jgi:hypothetical protein